MKLPHQHLRDPMQVITFLKVLFYVRCGLTGDEWQLLSLVHQPAYTPTRAQIPCLIYCQPLFSLSIP